MEFGNAQQKESKAVESISNSNTIYRFSCASDSFNKIPGKPIAYWTSRRIYEIYSNSNSLIKFAEPKSGIMTGNNELFLSFGMKLK